MTHYRPAETTRARFVGIRTFMRLPALVTTESVDFAIVGIPLDAATSFRTGARFGPEAIRSMSALLPSYHPELGIDPFEVLSGVDYGDCAIIPGYVEQSYQIIQDTLTPIVAAGAVPIGLGGDHSITLPELRAIAETKGPIALIHFDAHLDTRGLHLGQPYGHGTPFRRAAEERIVDTHRSVHIGIRGGLVSASDAIESSDLGYEALSTSQVREMGPSEVAARVRAKVGNVPAFVSFDVDVLDPAFAPGTGTPAAGGLSTTEVIDIIRQLEGVEIAGMDVVEVLPAHDTAGITALVAATVIWELLSLSARSRSAMVASAQGGTVASASGR